MVVNTSGSQVIQEKVPPQEEFDNNFQPPIKSTFNYVASSDPFEGFKKKSGIFFNGLYFLYMNKQTNADNIKQRKIFRQQ